MNWITYILIQSICWQSSKKPKNVHKEGNTCAQGAEIDPVWKLEHYSQLYILFWRLNKTYHPRHPWLHQQILQLQYFFREQGVTFFFLGWGGAVVNRDRQVDGCAGAESCTCKKEFTLSGSWAAPEPWWWRTGGRMIDEDVRLQIDHQISGLLYLMLWCNQSHSSPLCPPLDGWICYPWMSGPNDVQAHTKLDDCAIIDS